METVLIQNNTKVYAYSNQDAPIVSELTPGEIIQIDPQSKKSSWLKVFFPDGKYGYIIPDSSVIYQQGSNLRLGIIAGTISAIISAILWATITLITNYQFGWMAIGVGFLVGKSILHFGKGDSPSFQISGAVFALLGCIIGNILSIIFLGLKEGLSSSLILNPVFLFTIMKADFSFMDIIFYIIAIVEGIRFSVDS